MTSDECAHTDLAAAWVLGMLTPVEAERFAEHLAACATCHAEVANLQEAVDAMADAVPPASPPVDLRARLMAAVEQEVDLFRAAGAYEAAPAKSRAHRSRVRRALTVLAGVALVGGGAVLGGLLASGEDRGPEPRTIPGVVTRGGGGPGARCGLGPQRPSSTRAIRSRQTTGRSDLSGMAGASAIRARPHRSTVLRREDRGHDDHPPRPWRRRARDRHVRAPARQHGSNAAAGSGRTPSC